MKLLAGFLLLATSVLAYGAPGSAISGTWEGTATVHGQQVPVRLQLTGTGANLKAALVNGPETSAASSATVTGNHLLVTFNYYAKTLDATLADGQLTGSFGTVKTRYPVTLHPAIVASEAGPGAPDIGGDWEIAVKSAKDESALPTASRYSPGTRRRRSTVEVNISPRPSHLAVPESVIAVTCRRFRTSSK